MKQSIIELRYPFGAGGNWLSKVLSNYNFTSENYKHFHDPFKSRVNINHNVRDSCDYIYSGKYQFNFFCNHIYKFHHLSINQFSTSDYDTCFKKIVGTSFELAKDCQYTIDPYFDFADLLVCPDVFYNKIKKVQHDYQRDESTQEYFTHARKTFINSCVGTSEYFNNFDSIIWVGFVLGQLMEQSIYPDFNIGLEQNYIRVRDFAWKNRHLVKDFPHWNNPVGTINWDSEFFNLKKLK